MATRPRLTLSASSVALTGVLTAVVVLVCTIASVAVLRRDLTQEYEQRALAIARSTAQQQGLAHLVLHTRPRPDGPVERRAEAVRRATGALYVVVTDHEGIRYSHPTRSRIGEVVSTSPDQALAGREVVAVERGTLGLSARGKVPLRDSHGQVVGEVSVGIDIATLDQATRDLALGLGLLALLPLGLGLAGAWVLGRRLRRTTLGLQPEQMADLVLEHEAVLHGVTDAVIGIDNDAAVTVTNPQAVSLLGGTPTRGRPLDPEVDPEVVRLLEEQPAPRGALRLVRGRAVLATRLPVRRGGRDLGQVLILRDRSDLDSLAQELESTRALTDALRAQGHEHTNRLHALAGLLHQGNVDEALGYLDELSLSATWIEGVDDPYLAGLLAAKAAVAGESGVALEITTDSHVPGPVPRPLDTVTVVGNLLDNAIRAAATGSRRPPRVEVTVLTDGDALLIHVSDSGDGIPADQAEAIFGHGVTSRDERRGHGLGLVLARYTARSSGGDVVLRDPGGPPPAEHGAVFEARMGAER